jgi:hypothetical protein
MRAVLNLHRKTLATHPFLVLPSKFYQDSNSNQIKVKSKWLGKKKKQEIYTRLRRGTHVSLY